MEETKLDFFGFCRQWLSVAEKLPEGERFSFLRAVLLLGLDGKAPPAEEVGVVGSPVLEVVRDSVLLSRRKSLRGYLRGKDNGGKICTAKNGNRNAAKADADALGAVGAESSTGKGRARFVPPTVEEVAAYCRERKNGIDAEQFVAVYQASGWKLANGNALRDWKAAVRTWEGRDRARGGRAPGGSAPAAQAPVDLFRDDDEGL